MSAFHTLVLSDRHESRSARLLAILLVQGFCLFSCMGCIHPDPAVRQAWQRASGKPAYLQTIDTAMTKALASGPDKTGAFSTGVWVVDQYYKTGASADDLKKYRNLAVHEWINEDDEDFQNYVLVFGFQQRSASLTGDITTLMLDTAATITHGEQAKTVLAGIAALSVGTKVAFDKEIFFQNTFPSLVKQMLQVRSDKRKDIEDKLASSADDAYPLPAAISDLREYEVLGSLTGVLSTIGNATTPPSVDAGLDQWAKGLTGMTVNPTAKSTFKIESTAWNSGHTALTLTGTKTPADGVDAPTDASIKTALDKSADAAGPDIRARLEAASVTTAVFKASTTNTTQPTTPLAP